MDPGRAPAALPSQPVPAAVPSSVSKGTSTLISIINNKNDKQTFHDMQLTGINCRKVVRSDIALLLSEKESSVYSNCNQRENVLLL